MPANAPRSDLRLVLHDEYGDMYADPQGYLWRPPSYEPRYAVLHAAGDRSWSMIGGWFRSAHPSREYAPSAAEQLYHSQLDPGGNAKATAAGAMGLVLLGGAIYVAAQVAPAIIKARYPSSSAV